MLKNLGLKTKLLIAFSFISMFILAVAGVGHHSLNKIQKEYGFITDVIFVKSQRLGEFNHYTHEAHRLIFRGYMAFNDKNTSEIYRLEKRFKETSDLIKKMDADYRALPYLPGGKPYYDAVSASWIDYTKKAEHIFKLLDKAMTGQATEEAIKNFIDKDLREARLDTTEKFGELSKFMEKIAFEKKSEAMLAHERANTFGIVFSLTGVLLALTVGFQISSKISGTISKISDDIINSSAQTTSASQQLTSASSQLSQGATESAASLEETVSSLEELSSMVKLNSDHAKEASSLSQKTLHSAQLGEKEMAKLIEAMEGMSKSSKKIEEIINVIDDIAFQTNLLALNAAVEAARAGEQGRGFAVVADAVRNLAGRSSIAAKDINSLIKENVEKTIEGVEIADSSGASLKEILQSVKKVAELNSEISAASQEQANGIEQISKAMNHLDQAIQENAASSEEVASSAEEMSAQAEFLSGLILDMENFVKGNTHQEENKTPHSARPKLSLVSRPSVDERQSFQGKASGF